MDKNQLKLIQSTSSSKFLPNFILAPILAIVIIFIGQILGFMLFISVEAYISNAALCTALLLTLTCGMSILLMFIWIHFVEKRTFRTLGFYRNNMLINYIKGFIIGLVMFTAVMILMFVTGQAKVSQNPSITVGVLAIPSILIVLPGWLIQGASEEILTRGWLMNVLIVRYNLPFGLIFSSTLFGALHLLNEHVSYIAIINIILVGLFFGLYALKTENLWGACGAHSAWNWAQGSLFGLEVSGNTMDAGSFIQTDLVGADLITGGAFGPEGGLLVSLVLMISIIMVYRLPWKQVLDQQMDA
ncbi:CPBP family intramembrane glutamic endopeptidase [Fusibacter sp. 3D3]|uniref:CPBP family intramembrane glutamic endopeptidase n=1 Tax=Fusibacter sp. 3D3 TaxID=1048380 RepID=UPI000853D540|nr:type II CAAX endopeptidase family protein [Fusibacter sp. 3D3]GAU78510.1 CAAX amino terminal protease family [Fusibacter sp. 3D3]